MKFLLILSVLSNQSFAVLSSQNDSYPGDCLIEYQETQVPSALTNPFKGLSEKLVVDYAQAGQKRIIVDLKERREVLFRRTISTIHIDDFYDQQKDVILLKNPTDYILAGLILVHKLNYHALLEWNDKDINLQIHEGHIKLMAGPALKCFVELCENWHKYLPLSNKVIILNPLEKYKINAKTHQVDESDHKIQPLNPPRYHSDEKNVIRFNEYRNNIDSEIVKIEQYSSSFKNAIEPEILVTCNPKTFSRLDDTNRKELLLEYVSHLKGPIFNRFKHLESLRITKSYLPDTSVLKHLDQAVSLRHLRLDQTCTTNLEGLRGLKKIARLIIETNPITDITPIADLTQLEVLTLTGCWKLKKIAPTIQRLTNLKYLNLGETAVEHVELWSKYISFQRINLEKIQSQSGIIKNSTSLCEPSDKNDN